MYRVDVYLLVRRAVMVDGMSMREASRASCPFREMDRATGYEFVSVPDIKRESDGLVQLRVGGKDIQLPSREAPSKSGWCINRYAGNHAVWYGHFQAIARRILNHHVIWP